MNQRSGQSLSHFNTRRSAFSTEIANCANLHQYIPLVLVWSQFYLPQPRRDRWHCLHRLGVRALWLISPNNCFWATWERSGVVSQHLWYPFTAQFIISYVTPEMHFYIWMMWLLLQVLYQVIGIQGWIGIEEESSCLKDIKIEVYVESCWRERLNSILYLLNV